MEVCDMIHNTQSNKDTLTKIEFIQMKKEHRDTLRLSTDIVAPALMKDILRYMFGGGRRRLGKKAMRQRKITKLEVVQRPSRMIINRAIEQLKANPTINLEQAEVCLMSEMYRFEPLPTLKVAA